MSKNNVYTVLGASNHVKEERQEVDFYATHPIAAKLLCEVESFNTVLEPAAGAGHLSKELKKYIDFVHSSDLMDHGYGETGIDFLTYYERWNGDIVTNPPYKEAEKFIRHALDIIPNGRKVAMFLKVQFLEGKARKKLFEEYPFKTMYVSSSRIMCAKNGDFDGLKSSSAIAYAWYVWEKGFKNDPVIKWIN